MNAANIREDFRKLAPQEIPAGLPQIFACSGIPHQGNWQTPPIPRYLFGAANLRKSSLIFASVHPI